ncbi:MAG: CvpA family protein [Chloroflexi bacterium]|jgi:membrane protein required for colicin V production|nr:MAG: CvpA family protein [Chloroflexota bacterium]
MNWLDFAIIFVIIGFVVGAYAAGLIREAVTLVAAILGIVVAGLLYDDLAADILVFMNDEDAAQAISFLILVGAVYLFGQIVALMLSRTASLLMLGWADHAGGAVFGFLKGLIVVQALLIVLAAYPSLGMKDAVAGSQLAPYFVDDVDILLWVLPDNFDSRIERFLAPQPSS